MKTCIIFSAWLTLFYVEMNKISNTDTIDILKEMFKDYHINQIKSIYSFPDLQCKQQGQTYMANTVDVHVYSV